MLRIDRCLSLSPSLLACLFAAACADDTGSTSSGASASATGTGDGDGDGDTDADGTASGDSGNTAESGETSFAESTAGTSSSDGSTASDGSSDSTGSTGSGSTTGDGDGDGDGDGPPIPATCEEAAGGGSTVGCLFYAVDLDTHDQVEASYQYAVAVSNVQLDQVASVTIEKKQGGNWINAAGPTNVDALDLAVFNLPDLHQDDSGVKVGGAYRLTSDVPIIAYQFNPVDGSQSYLSDASMLYPVPSWDIFNHVIGWVSTNDGWQEGAYASIVAAVDDTEVQIVPSVATLAGPNVPAGQAGVPFFVTLDEGDLVEIMTKTQNVGLTGTQIFTEEGFPVAVFSGQECAFIPSTTYACDHLEEQISGVRLWGSHFIASRMPPRVSPPERTLWQIYAAEDDTTVTLTADNEVTGLPNSPFSLDKGEMQQFYANGTVDVPGDFEVEADKPIAVTNYMTGSEDVMQGFLEGDPAMVQLSPVEQYLPRYVMLVPATWMNDIAIITRPEGSAITIDGMPVDDNDFVPVADSGYEVGRISLADGVHLFDGEFDEFSVIIVGYDQWDSYAYLGGSGTGIINPDPQ